MNKHKLKGLIAVGIMTASLVGCTTNKMEKNNTPNNNQSINNENKRDNKNTTELLEQRLANSSYSSEVNPKELSMEDSIDYVEDVLNDDIIEIGSKYEKGTGVTEKIYDYDGNRVTVRYMHPYISNGNSTNEYDLTKTVGIDFKVDKSSIVEKNTKKSLEQRLINCSYTGKTNPRELSMEDSVDYVEDVLNDDIIEIGNKYNSDTGITEKVYDYNGNAIDVKYVHPHKVGSDNPKDYDLTKTIGIEFSIKEK